MNKPCVNKECQFHDIRYGVGCDVWATPVHPSEYCKRYIPEPEKPIEQQKPCVNKECKHYRLDYQDGSNCNFFEPNDRDYLCKKYIPEPEKPVEPQEIALDIDWCHYCSPCDWDEVGEVPINYRFKCFEFDLPGGTKIWKHDPICFYNREHRTHSDYTANLKGWETIHASRVIFEKIEGEIK